MPAAVGAEAYASRRALVQAARLLSHAHLWWLLPAVLAIGGVYLCRASVYSIPLRLLGYSFTQSFLWSTALISTSLHQLIPAAGASGYAFLTYALTQRGVSGGQASLIALIDTLSSAAAAATLVVGSLVYLAVAGTFDLRRFAAVFAAGAALVAFAAWVYHLQREERRLVALVLRLKDRLAALLGAAWPDEPVRAFLHDYYRGKATIRSSPGAFYRMMGFQSLAVCCDVTALYMGCLALGLLPKVWVVFIAFVVAMTGLSVVGVPGGGGSFEVIMSAFLATHGLGTAQAIAAAILYRIVAFWIPVVASLFLLLRFRRWKREIRAAPPEAKRREASPRYCRPGMRE